MTDSHPDTFTAPMRKETPPLEPWESNKQLSFFHPPVLFMMNYITVIIVVVLSPIFISLLLILIALIIFLYRRGYFARSTAVIPPIQPAHLDRGSSLFNEYPEFIELQNRSPPIIRPVTPIHERRLPYLWTQQQIIGNDFEERAPTNDGPPQSPTPQLSSIDIHSPTMPSPTYSPDK
jgi:hypothetical protein